MASIAYAAWYVKDPDAVLDYPLGWRDWLLPGDRIVEVAASVSPAGLTVDRVEHTETVTVAWLSGGTVEVKYAVTFHITTLQGREDDRTILVAVRQR